jgi:aryl-alcohol dehydrogenase-like predicted oxidoreductase
MRHRRFGRLGWQVSDVGYGMWGMGSWSGSDDAQSLASLRLAVELGCNFFDTAAAYGAGRSERLLRELIRSFPDRTLYAATKVPPADHRWPAAADARLEDVFPGDHVRRHTERSLENMGVDRIDLLQFHVWNDAWAGDERWQRVADDLRREDLVAGIGISINRWEPSNALRTLRTGAIDAVQVIYNILDQSPEDELFPLCRELDIAVIARVPFDEGTLTGTLTRASSWPEGDFRRTYFNPDNLEASVRRADALGDDLPAGMPMPEAALRFILSSDDVAVTIPGMRSERHVRENLAASDAGPLPADLMERLRAHRWDRTPAPWSG